MLPIVNRQFDSVPLHLATGDYIVDKYFINIFFIIFIEMVDSKAGCTPSAVINAILQYFLVESFATDGSPQF